MRRFLELDVGGPLSHRGCKPSEITKGGIRRVETPSVSPGPDPGLAGLVEAARALLAH